MKQTLTKTRLSLTLLVVCFVLMLGIVFANPAGAAHAEETDQRIVVSTITATSNIDDIIGFGKSVKSPSFNIKEDVPAQFQTQYNWEKKTATSWEDYSGTAFTEGTYRYVTQIRIDRDSGGATTHVLDKNGITVTVNDVKWDNSIPDIYDTYSFAWVSSKEYEVVAPAGTPLDFIKDNNWDINKHYINQAITAFSVADGAAGGTKPYTFSKVSGPEWINVAADGTVSGTPTVLGANADLVIKVTDNAAEPATKEITLRVGNTYVLPADREVISVIKATSNIGDKLGYGKPVFTPSFTFTEGTQANFPYSMGHWYKKEGTAWKRYEEATFTEGTYMYSNQLRVDDEAGRTHVLNKDGVSVYIDDVLCADNQKPEIYDTYSLIYVDTAEHEVVKAVNDELVPVTDLEKVFNDAAQEPTFGGTLVRGTDFEVSYAVKVGAGGALDFSEKPVNAGTYIVTVTGKGAYEGSFTKEFVINKAAQTDVPVGLIVNPISCREDSGTIDGVTTAMEYRRVGDADYTKCTSSKITGLAAGEYKIRYAEDDNYLASDDVTVTIAISHNLGTLIEETPATCIAGGMKAHYYCPDCGKFFDEGKKETTEAALTIPTTGVHTFGTLIEEQPATCIAGGMKAHYKCTVCGKYFDENKNETTEEALKTPVSPYYGHSFGFWVEEQYATCQAPGRKGYKHCSTCNKDYDASNKEITDFVIPVNPDGHELGDLVAEVPATCKDTGVKEHRDCRLCGKHCDPITRKEIADLAIPTTNNHTYGELIPEVSPTTTEFGVKEHKDCTVCGRHFDKDGNEITDLRIAKIGTHNVIVNGESNFYAHGESVTVTAEDKEGKVFKCWKDESGNIVSTDKSYTFTVAEATTLTAVYDDMPSGGGEITPPAKNDGLSGGAIAGIVIGTLLFAGIGGFAIFWFAVKKKTFADLGAILKKGFTAMGNFFKTLGAKIKALFTKKK